MSMLHWIRQENLPNLIIFVHGLNGGNKTWNYDKEISFPSLLFEEESLSDSHDIVCFEYFTTFTNMLGKGKSFIQRVIKSIKKSQKNLPIFEIAELLRGELITNLIEYENVVIVAHSMGGLVVKSCFLQQMENDRLSNIKGYISLAVPHSGSVAASLGSHISKNIQIKDLSLLSGPIDTLTREWLHAPFKPECYYIYGTNDNVVDKKSALPVDATRDLTMAVNDSHTSICKPSNKKETVYKAVLQKILEFSTTGKKDLNLEPFVDKNQYDDDFFVIKLIIADVHNKIQGHAKEYFYNAELARKIFTSDNDRKTLSELYLRIKNIYQEEYEHYLVNDTPTDSLVSSVHAKIMTENNSYLSTTISDLDNIHKKGMLHQLANKLDLEVIWSDNTDIESLRSSGKDNV
jgi:protein SERAC1